MKCFRYLSIAPSILSLALLGALNGCADKKGHSPTVRVVFVHGDPSELIAGAELNPRSPVTSDNWESFSNYYLFTGQAFTQRAIVLKNLQRNIEAENRPRSGAAVAPVMVKMKMKRSTEQLSWLSADGEMELIFTEAPDHSLQITSLRDGKAKPVPFSVLHWSRSDRADILSVLGEYTTERDGKVLLALYFAKPVATQSQLPKTNKRYIYNLGPGVKVGWDQNQPVEMDICGLPQDQANQVKQMGSQWAEQLKDRLDLRFRAVKTFRPFSDLNQHCFYLVSEYLTAVEENIAMEGLTFPVYDWESSQLIDADIFFFQSELNKIIKAAAKGPQMSPLKLVEKQINRFYYIAIHELGHFLGLHHQFSGIRSVMSYKLEVPLLQAYDKEAIQALYDLRGADSTREKTPAAMRREK